MMNRSGRNRMGTPTQRNRKVATPLRSRLSESNTRRRGLLTESDTYDNQLMTELVDLWYSLGLPEHTSHQVEAKYRNKYNDVDDVMEEIKELGKEYGVRDLPMDLYRLGKVNADVWNRVFGKYQGSNGDRLGDIYNMFDMVNFYCGGWKAFAKGNYDFTDNEWLDYYDVNDDGDGSMSYDSLDEYGYWDTWYGQVVKDQYGL